MSQELMYDLFSSLPRGAPGSDETTRRVLSSIGPLPEDVRVLDLGCGTGAQSRVLARELQGLVCVDVAPLVLEILMRRADDAGLSGKIRPVAADMAALPFRKGTFGLIWCESAIYNMGFERGLGCLSGYLEPGGQMVVSEVVWLTNEPSAENQAFWSDEYPGMIDLEEARETVGQAGLELFDEFALAEADVESFYSNLENALPEFLSRHPGNTLAKELDGLCRKEMDLQRRFGSEYGFVFFLMRKPHVS